MRFEPLPSGGGDKVSQAKRDRVYCALALLDLLEEPARLAPLVGI